MAKVKSDLGIMVDKRLVKFIGSLMVWNESEPNECYSIHLNDIDETFWFNDKVELQEFVNAQASERFYDVELRKGEFAYINENNEKVVYIISDVSRGRLTIERIYTNKHII